METYFPLFYRKDCKAEFSPEYLENQQKNVV